MIGSNDDEMFAKWEERGKLQLKNYLQWHTKRPAQIGGDHASIKLTAGALDVPPPDNTILSAVAAASSATASSAPTSSTVSSSDASNAIALAGSRMFAAVTGDATPAVSAAHARGSIARRAGAAAADEANPNADPESSATEPAASEPAAAAAALAGSRMFAAITGDAGANADVDADAPEDSGDAAADASTLGDAGGKLFASMV